MHTNSADDIVLIPEDAASANKRTGSLLQTEEREEWRGEEDAAVPDHAGPGRAVPV